MAARADAAQRRVGWRPGAGSAFAGLALTVVLGVLVGAWLGDRSSEPGTADLTLADPALASAEAPALRSAAGFTGFGGLPAIPGAALQSGAVVESEPGLVAIEADGATIEVRYASADRLFEVAPLERELAPGDLVVLSSDTETARGVLVVPADIEEGVGGAQ